MTTSSSETVANRIIELTPNGIIDKMMEYDEVHCQRPHQGT